mmetsp:Transcript_28344/g.62488  ORF Transcript_28344/g.62488 Transcript_28344/m.62488 type:complete len:99 (-) Transcript_28344:77-373(-)
MCKGTMLGNIHSRSPGQLLVYVGDGKNDLCPALSAHQYYNQVVICIKKDHSLHNIIKKNNVYPPQNTQFKYWKEEVELINILKEIIPIKNEEITNNTV